MDERRDPAPEEAADPGDAPAEEPLEAFYGQDDIFGLELGAKPMPRPPVRKARTATGALLTGIALGLRDIFDPEKKRDTIAIEQEAPGEPEGPQRYEIRLNGSPRDGQAIYRPWVEGDEPGPE
jgi:hypothetical protein